VATSWGFESLPEHQMSKRSRLYKKRAFEGSLFV
jgi:hypothetical protein